MLGKSVRKPFENDFEGIVSLIAPREKSLEPEIHLVNHVHVRASLERCAQQQNLIEGSRLRTEMSVAASLPSPPSDFSIRLV